MFQSLAFALERDTFIVDDVLEQLADGIVRFLLALLFETLWRYLKTVGQWHRIVGLKTDLIRAEKSTKKRKKPQKKKQKQSRKQKKIRKKNQLQSCNHWYSMRWNVLKSLER